MYVCKYLHAREKSSCNSQLRNSLQKNNQDILIIHNNIAPKKEPERVFGGFWQNRGLISLTRKWSLIVSNCVFEENRAVYIFVDRVTSVSSSNRNNLQDPQTSGQLLRSQVETALCRVSHFICMPWTWVSAVC